MTALALLALALLVWPRQSGAALRIADLARRGRLLSAPAHDRQPPGDGWLPSLRLRVSARRRSEAQEAGVVRAIRLLAQELRDGADPARAWAGAATVGNAESGWIAFVARRAAMGEPIGPALQRVAAGRLGLAPASEASIARLGAAWACSAGSGASAADVLDQWVGDAQARQRAAAQIDSELAGPRASALLLAALPLLGLAMGMAMGADPLRTLLGGAAGLMVLGCGVLLEIVGVLWVRRIVSAALGA